jgi:hypothetical protein
MVVFRRVSGRKGYYQLELVEERQLLEKLAFYYVGTE